MSNQSFNNNPFIQNPQDPNFQFNQGINYNTPNSIPTPGTPSGGISPMSQNIPSMPPTPPMNPNFRPMPPMPPMPQNKSSGGLIIAIVVALVLLLVSGLGVGGFIYWNNFQKQQAIEKLSATIDGNLEKYNDLTEQTIKDLESLSKAFDSVTRSNAVEGLSKIFQDNKNLLVQIEQKHQDLINTIDSDGQDSVKEFNDNLKKEIENVKQVISSNKNLYESAFCYLKSINDLDQAFLRLSPLFNKLENSGSSIQNYINTTNQILDEVTKLETASQTIISCLEQNPNFGSSTLISNFKNVQQNIAQMKQGLEIFRSGLQNNKIKDVEGGSKMFVEAFSKLKIYQIDQSSLPDVPKETAKAVNEYKQRVNSGKKNLEEKKKQVLEKVQS